jgi:hypothetical protein
MKANVRGLILPALVLAILVASAVPASATGTAYTFNLIGPNTAEAQTGAFADDTIRLTGAGAFDTTARTVVGSGSFTHIKADGSVFARGTWQATAFTSFDPFGGPNTGQQGGELVIVVTLFPAGGSPVPGLMMTVTCELGSPPSGTEEGTTLGDFMESTGGLTLIHLAS